MGALFSPQTPAAPPPPLPPTLTAEDPELIERRRRLRLAASQRRGRAANILTSGLGDLSVAPLARPSLTQNLGGDR